jgi:two-component system OmpR family response regulator
MSSDPKTEIKVAEDDIFSLTAEGKQELNASGTALGTLELELMVLVDGSSKVAQIAERMKGIPAVAVLAAFRNLVSKKLVETGGTVAPSGNIEIGDFLKTGAFYVPMKGATAEHAKEAAEGMTTLKQQGYYVRIARRALAERKLVEGARLTALIVEDEPHLSKLLRTFLAIEGFETRVAANRAEIIEALRRPPAPELALLDVMLPDADGFDILAKLRQHPALKNMAIIMLTAKSTREAVLKGLAGGADGYITKPFEIEVLMKAVRAVLGLANT